MSKVEEMLPASELMPALREARSPSFGNTALLEAITKAASDPNVDIEKMERLFGMYERMLKHDSEKAFNAAMSRAQSKIQPIVNNSANDHTGSTYADLAAINRQIVPIYTAEGLSISFDTETKNEKDPIPEGYIRTIAFVSHEAGHTRRYHIDLPPDDVGTQGKVNKTKVQASGSTNSYARRYLERMIFNLSTEDDNDGNGDEPEMPKGQRADFEAAIEALTDRAGADALWQKIATACTTVGDIPAYDDLKKKLAAKAKTFKQAKAAA